MLRRLIFVISLPFGILDFVLPIYGKSVGASALQIGMFFSAFSLMIVLLRPLVGAWLDRWGRRPFFLAGMAGYSLTMLLFAASSSAAGVILARSVQGIASACLWLSAQAMTADVVVEQRRGRSFGAVFQASSQGAILGTFLGFWVIFSVAFTDGWKLLFSGYGAASAAAAGLAVLQVKETLPGRAQIAPGGNGTPAESQPAIRWTRSWITLLAVAAITGASWSMMAPVMMIFLQDRFTAEVNELALAFLPAALVWATLPSRLGGLADRFGRKPLMVIGMSAAAATCFAVPVLTSLTMLAVFWAFQALCTAAGDPAEQALVADLTGGDARGRGFGLYTMAAGMGAVAGPIIGGWLYQAHNPTAPFYAAGAVLAAAVLLVLIFLTEPMHEKEPGVENSA